MKSFIFLLILLSPAWAQSQPFHCQMKYNYQPVFEADVNLPHMKSNLSVGKFEQFEIFLSSLGNDKVELQLLDASEPARSYATAFIGLENKMIDLSLWKRDYIIEVNCSLKL